MFKEKLLSLLKQSSKSPWGGFSSTRISAYFLLIAILLFSVVFLGIEVYAAVVSLKLTGTYVISNEAIIIFASLLTHHLTLLGINKSSETKQLKNNNTKPEEINSAQKADEVKKENEVIT